MGIVGDFLKDVFSIGLRTMNDEINQKAVEQGLITPKGEEEPSAPGAHCRPDYQPLYQRLTGLDQNGGPA